MSRLDSFEACFAELLGHEGGYVDHPNDPGGATRWGVTERVARANGYIGDMQDFPQLAAQHIYRAEYWNSVRADELPMPLRYAVFDAAVNSGPEQAVKWLQRAIGADVDGDIGPQTIALAHSMHPDYVMRKMLAQRLQFLTNLKTWSSFGKGWARRIASLLES